MCRGQNSVISFKLKQTVQKNTGVFGVKTNLICFMKKKYYPVNKGKVAIVAERSYLRSKLAFKSYPFFCIFFISLAILS